MTPGRRAAAAKWSFQASQLDAVRHIRMHALIRDMLLFLQKSGQTNLLISLLVSVTNASVCTTSGPHFSAVFCSCTEGSGTTSTFVGSYGGAFYACSISPSFCSIYLMRSLVVFMMPSEINVPEPLRKAIFC